MLTERQQELRYAMCLGRQGWGIPEHTRVIHTDEMSVDNDPKMVQDRVLRRPGEEYHPDCIQAGHHSGRCSVMYWAGVCGDYHTDLIALPPKCKMNSGSYRDFVLEQHLWPFYVKMTEIYGHVLVLEDNCPGHRGKAVQWRVINDL